MDAKLNNLETLLRQTDGAIVAFSAGVDSTFLLKIAYSVLGERAIALTAASPTMPPGELEAAKEFAKTLGCRHIVIDSNELVNPSFAQNPANRCFFCKDELYRICRDQSENLRVAVIVDGTNLDDLKDHRPGLKAAKEWGIRHPLVEAEMTGDDAGSTAQTLTALRRSFSTSPTPVIVPPVPTPATKASIRLNCFNSSIAVVRRWASGLAGLLNCWGMK